MALFWRGLCIKTASTNGYNANLGYTGEDIIIGANYNVTGEQHYGNIKIRVSNNFRAEQANDPCYVAGHSEGSTTGGEM